MKTLIKVMLASIFISTGTLAEAAPQGVPYGTTDIIKDTNFKGGLIVHLGCGDGELTAALHLNERCLVHGLDSDPGAVAKARKHIRYIRSSIHF